MRKAVFFKRLFIAYTFIVLLYTFIASSIYFYNQNLLTKRNIQNQNRIFVEQAGDKIDTKLRIAFNLKEQLKTNTDVIEYANHLNKNYYNIFKIHIQLSNHLDAFSQFGYRISIGKMGENMMITPQYTIRVNDYLEEQGFTSFDKEQIDHFFLNEKYRYFLASTDQEKNHRNKDCLLYASQESVGRESKQLLFFLWFNKDNLLPSLQNKAEDLFFILDDEKIILSTENEKMNKAEKQIITPTLLEEIQRNSKDRGVYYRLQKDQYYIHVVTSTVETMPWKYVYLTPKNHLYEGAGVLKIKTAGIYLFLLLTGMILALVISKKMYRPVDDIVSSFGKYTPEKQSLGEKPQDEFAYIQERVTQINETNIKLKETIKNNQETLKTKFLRELMHGILSRKQIKEQIYRYHLTQFEKSSTVVILQYRMDQEIEKNVSTEGFFVIKKQIFSWIEKYLKAKVQVEMFEFDYKRSILILPERDTAKITRELNELLLKIEETFEVNMIAAVGNSVDSLYQANESFRSAVNLLEYQFVWGNHLILTDDDLKEFKNEIYYYPLDMERTLIEHVLKGRKEEVTQILERILEENLTSRNLAPDALSQFIFAIVATSNRIMHQMITVDKQILEQREINYIELKMSENKEQLKQKIVELFVNLVDHCVQETEKREDTMIDEMISFIHEHYDTDLSLTDIAEQFNLSSGYVGILFKKSTGENFKDYLNIYKVQKAKEILETEDIKIKDLAQRVGCNTTNTFIRMFKKYVGISPGQYGEQVKEKRNK